MLKIKAMTLIETLLAFSIFVGSIIIIFSCYTNALNHYQKTNQEFQRYLELQNEKEKELWQNNSLDASIAEVLH